MLKSQGMERLPTDHRKLLNDIRSLDGKAFGLKMRLESLSDEEAFIESQELKDLDRMGFVVLLRQNGEIAGTPVEITVTDNTIVESGYSHDPSVTQGFVYPHGFVMTPKGRRYRWERLADFALWLAAALTVAVASGFFAWLFTNIAPR